MAAILLAEDDAAMRQFLKLALEKAGHSVVDCPDGEAAVKALGESGPFDMLLADIVMPGIDGIDLSHRAKELFPDLKVMFITGFAAVAMSHVEQMEAPPQVLSKPFHLRELVSQVEQLLASP